MAYFRIYLNSHNEVAIIQLGECDELDYNQNRFLSDERFDSEDDAVAYLNENQDKLPTNVYNPYSQTLKNVLDW